jgi:hypothetical protein
MWMAGGGQGPALTSLSEGLPVGDEIGSRLGAAREDFPAGPGLERLGGPMSPDSNGVVQVWQTPVRQDQRVGTSRARARSSTLRVGGAEGHGQTAAAMIGARVAAVLLSLGTAPLADAAVLTRPSGPRGPTRVRRPAI